MAKNLYEMDPKLLHKASSNRINWADVYKQNNRSAEQMTAPTPAFTFSGLDTPTGKLSQVKLAEGFSSYLETFYPHCCSNTILNEEFTKIVVVLGGFGTLEVGDKAVPLMQGTTVIVAPGKAHKFRTEESQLTVSIVVQNGYLQTTTIVEETELAAGVRPIEPRTVSMRGQSKAVEQLQAQAAAREHHVRNAGEPQVIKVTETSVDNFDIGFPADSGDNAKPLKFD